MLTAKKPAPTASKGVPTTSKNGRKCNKTALILRRGNSRTSVIACKPRQMHFAKQSDRSFGITERRTASVAQR